MSNGKAPRVPNERMKQFLESVDWEPAYRNCNLWYDRLSRSTRLKDRADRVEEFKKIEFDIKAMKKRAAEKTNLLNRLWPKDPPAKTFGKNVSEILIGLMTPAMGRVQDAYDRLEQLQRNLDIAFALTAYQRDNGKYPVKLADLSPRYLAALPNDLFSGQDLIYRPMDKGYLLYSVGPNGQDDGGLTADDNPGADDIVVRMPLPRLNEPK